MSWWLSPVEMTDEGLRLQRAHEKWVLPAAHRRLGAFVDRLGQDGRYELIGLLNRGGQAFLWAARDRSDDERLVVVKTVSPRTDDPVADRRLTREARLLRHLAGAATVMPLMDWGPAHLRGQSPEGEFETERPWLVLPYRPHLSLDRAVALNRGPLGPDAVWQIGRDIAAGLAHLHGRGVVHRDLSLRNVLLTPTGCMLADLGMAWSATIIDEGIEQKLTTGLTRQSRGVTWGWLAPEAAQPPVDDRRPDREPAADVFCWGLHVYCALAGHHPWDARRFGVDDEHGFEMYELRRAPDLAPVARADLPVDLREAVRAALDADPGARPTADELLSALGGLPPSEVVGAAQVADLRRELRSTEATLATERARSAEVARRPERADGGGRVRREAAPEGLGTGTGRGMRTARVLLATSLTVAVGLLAQQGFSDFQAVREGGLAMSDAGLLEAGQHLLSDLGREAVAGSSGTKGRAATDRDAATFVARLAASDLEEDRVAAGAVARYTAAMATLANTRDRVDMARKSSNGWATYWQAAYHNRIDALAALLRTVENRTADAPAGSWTDPVRRDRLITDAQVALNVTADPLLDLLTGNTAASAPKVQSIATGYAPFLSAVAQLAPAAGTPTVLTYARIQQDSRQIGDFTTSTSNLRRNVSSTSALFDVVDQTYADLSAYQQADMAPAVEAVRHERRWALIRLAVESAVAALLITLAGLAVLIVFGRRRRRRRARPTGGAGPARVPEPEPEPQSEPATVVQEPVPVTRRTSSDWFGAPGDPETTRSTDNRHRAVR